VSVESYIRTDSVSYVFCKLTSLQLKLVIHDPINLHLVFAHIPSKYGKGNFKFPCNIQITGVLVEKILATSSKTGIIIFQIRLFFI